MVKTPWGHGHGFPIGSNLGPLLDIINMDIHVQGVPQSNLIAILCHGQHLVLLVSGSFLKRLVVVQRS